MLAKIKDDVVVTFPYGYDNLCAENPYTKFSGDIDLMQIFPDTEEATLRGYQLVQVKIDDKPEVLPFIQKATLATTPTLKNGSWVLEWKVEPEILG